MSRPFPMTTPMVSAVRAAKRESRALVSARRLREMNAGAESIEIRSIEPIERTARVLPAPDLSSIPSNGNER